MCLLFRAEFGILSAFCLHFVRHIRVAQVSKPTLSVQCPLLWFESTTSDLVSVQRPAKDVITLSTSCCDATALQLRLALHSSVPDLLLLG